jgi:hypothetical protein
VIAHGIPDVGFVDPTYFKDQFGVEGKIVLLTLASFHPTRIECVLNALPAFFRNFRCCLHYIGRNASNELREHGKYRLSLEIRQKNKVRRTLSSTTGSSIWKPKEFIGAADLYITPYLTRRRLLRERWPTLGAGKP